MSRLVCKSSQQTDCWRVGVDSGLRNSNTSSISVPVCEVPPRKLASPFLWLLQWILAYVLARHTYLLTSHSQDLDSWIISPGWKQGIGMAGFLWEAVGRIIFLACYSLSRCTLALLGPLDNLNVCQCQDSWSHVQSFISRCKRTDHNSTQLATAQLSCVPVYTDVGHQDVQQLANTSTNVRICPLPAKGWRMWKRNSSFIEEIRDNMEKQKEEKCARWVGTISEWGMDSENVRGHFASELWMCLENKQWRAGIGKGRRL